ncbi:cell division protein ZapA [Pilibacter termitis]|uniref:Cell division protein ZapA n=1 Tax=Pilibacter termitis TaxID=263852 RepID=A0A1T4KGG5_9ENTE|nr:cell division protein ZapA [Pilibacter termitis]SJZ41504.1 cell division protein ZapA [Pilibacter termitis]
MVEKTRYKTEIAGNTYTIIGNETKTHMDMVSQLVNEQMKEIKELAKGTTNEQAAILTALNAMSDQLKKQEQLLSLKKELEEIRPLANRTRELEEKFSRIEEMENQAKQSLKDGESRSETPTHVEAQQILNETAKRKILKAQPNQETQQSSLDL